MYLMMHMAYSEAAICKIGHYGNDGRIYYAPYSEAPICCVGHVSQAGVIYNDPYSESSYCAIGYIGNKYFLPTAAAVFLLLFF